MRHASAARTALALEKRHLRLEPAHFDGDRVGEFLHARARRRFLLQRELCTRQRVLQLVVRGGHDARRCGLNRVSRVATHRRRPCRNTRDANQRPHADAHRQRAHGLQHIRALRDGTRGGQRGVAVNRHTQDDEWISLMGKNGGAHYHAIRNALISNWTPSDSSHVRIRFSALSRSHYSARDCARSTQTAIANRRTNLRRQAVAANARAMFRLLASSARANRLLLRSGLARRAPPSRVRGSTRPSAR